MMGWGRMRGSSAASVERMDVAPSGGEAEEVVEMESLLIHQLCIIPPVLRLSD